MKSSDILNHSFRVKMRGYDQEEVNDFLNDIADKMYELEEANKKLEHKLQLASDEISEYESKQNALNRSIIVAQEAADRLKEEAHNEVTYLMEQAEKDAERLKEASESQARKLLKEAVSKVHHIQEETEELRQQSVKFNIELNKMLETYQTVLGDDRWKELLSLDTINRVDLEHTVEAVHRLAYDESETLKTENAETTDYNDEKTEQENNDELGSREAVDMPILEKNSEE